MHWDILHDVNQWTKKKVADTESKIMYVDPGKSGSSKVMLKIVRVHLHHQGRMLDTYAVLDDGSEKTLLLHSAAHQLGVQGPREVLTIRTTRQDVKEISSEPHHKVSHNGKNQLVFNCSFQVGNQCLSSCLLPGPTLGPSLLRVLL